MQKSKTWYLNRLKMMSTAEIVHRLKTAVHARSQRFGLFSPHTPPAPNFQKVSRSWLNHVTGIQAEPYCRAADEILAGRLRIFTLHHQSNGEGIRWNRDLRSGKEAPLLFGKTLNYRDPGLVGDIKYLWEPNRHLHLVTLAQAYHLSGQSVYLKGIRTHLDSWFEQCPFLKGPNWTSSLELGIRLINWSWVWHLCGGLDSPLFAGPEGHGFRSRWLTCIYQHTHFIRGHFSRYSSANNHLIGELAGLFTATTTWPFWSEFVRWQETARASLIHEALLQNTTDGLNREQAISYQQFVLDFLLQAALIGLTNQVEFPRQYWERIEAMLVYLSAIMDVKGNVPMIGDADDGFVFPQPPASGFCPYRSLLATGAVLFNRPEFKAKAGALDDKSRWFLGTRAETEYAGIKAPETGFPTRRAFPEGGYYLLGDDFETDHEIRLLVDAGPLGYPSLAAHGHADALSFSLSLGGREFLIDPGTYAYHTNPQWRTYFRGTSAHNTVRVDEQDQSIMGGNFMWLKKAKATCEAWAEGEDQDLFTGNHDGYQRLADPVLHRRELRLMKKDRRLQVIDTLECRGTHLIESFWHFSESCSVNLQDSLVRVENGGYSMVLRLPVTGSEVKKARGNASPPIGWISRRYDEKVPTTTVMTRTKISGTTQLVTWIDCPLAADCSRQGSL